MKARLRTFVSAFLALSLLLGSAGTVVQASTTTTSVNSSVAQAAPPRIAYIYTSDTSSRDSFNALFTGRGVQVDLVPVGNVSNFDFSNDQTILIGDDTGNLGTWGDPSTVTATIAAIRRADKPIIGIGEGGYAFFGKLGAAIGYPNGAHGSEALMYAVLPSHSIYATPNPIAMPPDRVLRLYVASQNTVEILVPGASPANLIGRVPSEGSYYSLMAQKVSSLCYTLWGYSGAPSVMTSIGQDLFVNLTLGQPCGPLTATSPAASSPPVIDGMINFGEWPTSNRINFGHGFISMVNDGLRLYVLIDALGDTTNDTPTAETPDYFWLTFDVNGDGLITPDMDLNYGAMQGRHNIRYSYYVGPGAWTGLQSSTRSSLGAGFGCFFADNSLSFSRLTRLNCSSHRVWEMAIDLREIGAQPGGNVRMGVRAFSGASGFVDDVPANFWMDFSNLIQVSLANILLPVSTGATVSFQANPIEVTQATQTRTNANALVAKKTSVARTYVNSSGPGAEPVIVYLYGTRGGADLPGSPLALLMTAPVALNRNQLNHTANFSLPASWITAGGTTFRAAVARLTDISPSFSSPITLTFQTRRVPVFWIVQANTGTNASPVLASDAEISSQESYMKAIYPTSNIQFVRKSWQAIGTTSSLDDTITKLKSYHASVVLAWLFSVIFTGKEPYTLPDGIYGFRTSGGGTSDPTWNGGGGYVAAGYRGTSREGTMAHEFNHDLDRGAAPGTWGRHVGGCGTDGPQPSWPYPNYNINEVGFDTRLPWSTGAGGVDTVIPNNVPDLMSYCQSGRLPTKWISPYRWQNLFSFFSGGVPDLRTPLVVSDAYYISGRINQDGTGALDPVLIEPGLAVTQAITGGYSIEIQDAGGTPLLTQPFEAYLTDPEGEPRAYFDFNFLLPIQNGGARVVLKKEGQALATIVASANAPTVSLTAPNGGEDWSGVQTIEWNASDLDGGTLYTTILYTPDDGASWFPVASNVEGNSYLVDTTNLPGGSAAKIRVIVTDGFNTTQDDSDATFAIADHPPVVMISAPGSSVNFASGATITFNGLATDEDPVLPDTSYVWSYDSINFGSGPEVEAILPDGVHQVTLEVVDSKGNIGTYTMVVLVNAVQLYLPLIQR